MLKIHILIIKLQYIFSVHRISNNLSQNFLYWLSYDVSYTVGVVHLVDLKFGDNID